MAAKAFADLARHFLGPGHDLIKAAKLVQPLGGGFRPHLRNARDVIDAIPREGEKVDDLLRVHAKLFPHPGPIKDGVGHGIDQRDLGSHQLGKILIRGGNDHRPPASGLSGEGTNYVVRLDLGHHNQGEAVGADHLMERRNLCPEIWIHGRPVGLVIRVEVASKGFPGASKITAKGLSG